MFNLSTIQAVLENFYKQKLIPSPNLSYYDKKVIRNEEHISLGGLNDIFQSFTIKITKSEDDKIEDVSFLIFSGYGFLRELNKTLKIDLIDYLNEHIRYFSFKKNLEKDLNDLNFSRLKIDGDWLASQLNKERKEGEEFEHITTFHINNLDCYKFKSKLIEKPFFILKRNSLNDYGEISFSSAVPLVNNLLIRDIEKGQLSEMSKKYLFY